MLFFFNFPPVTPREKERDKKNLNTNLVTNMAPTSSFLKILVPEGHGIASGRQSPKIGSRTIFLYK